MDLFDPRRGKVAVGREYVQPTCAMIAYGESVKDKILYSIEIVLVILWIQPSAYLKVNMMNYYKK